MIDRYNLRKIFYNKDKLYENMLEERNAKLLKQYDTPTYYNPSVQEFAQIVTINHVWSVGDKYYKLANQYYGDPADWWLIAKFNNRPTEAHNKIGDILLIPTKIEQVKKLFKV